MTRTKLKDSDLLATPRADEVADSVKAFLHSFEEVIIRRVDPSTMADQIELDDEGRDLAIRAPNVIEWIVGTEWCNSPSVYEHARQYQILRDFFELRCPVCNPGGTGPGEPGDCMPDGKPRTRTYLESEVLLVWREDDNDDVCPKCGTTRDELRQDGLLNDYTQMHVVAGMRSGKSFTGAFLGTYVEHVVYTIAHKHPSGLHGYLKLQPGEKFEITFLASTDVQSQDTIWAKYTGVRGASPWFQRYVSWVKKQEARQRTPAGMKRWRYEEAVKRIINEHPKVRLILNSLNSNSGGLVGRTRIAAMADEISRMKQTDSAQGADEIYRGLENSLMTVRNASRSTPTRWMGVMVSVTSPISRQDKGMRLLKTGSRIEEMYTGHYETWNFNPHLTERDFDALKKKDPIAWRRDIKADPPGAANPLIHDEARFEQLAIAPHLVPRARFRIVESSDPTGQRYVGVQLVEADFIEDSQGRYVVFDAGLSFDQFAGACAHGEQRQDEAGNVRLVTVFDWVVRILPPEGYEVLFDSVSALIEALASKQPIARVEFDRWNSVQIIQQVRRLGISAEQHSTKDQDYVNFRVAAYSGLVEMLPPAPDDSGKDPPEKSAAGLAIYEIEGLEHNVDTGKVTNPQKGARRGWNSNDVAQCVVHAHRLVQGLGYTDRHGDRSRAAALKRAQEGGAAWAQRGSTFSIGGVGLPGVRDWTRGRGW